ncbi:MAG: TRAP transporter small permease [Syntrophaceae bacterium]|nr:TRAP transporter small permease [Syntrophaceae bacterium]
MRKIINLCALLSGILLLVIMGIISAEVVCRYFLHNPIIGVVEVSEFILIFIIFGSLAYTQSLDGHIRIELVTNNLSLRYQKILRIVALVLSFCIMALIAIQTGKGFWASWEIREVRWGIVPLPMYLVKFMVSSGCFLLCVQFVISLLDELRTTGRSAEIQE